uniref:IS200/IS605 family transposase n=1 Tax=Marinobacterium profundum TaxID=1714300 RepID=UPI001FE0A26A
FLSSATECNDFLYLLFFYSSSANQKLYIMSRRERQMCIREGVSMRPMFSVSNVVGYLKGKSAIAIARQFRGRQRNFNGEYFWARGYFVSTVGLDEEMVREYIRNQEKADEHRDQLRLGMM